MRTKMPTIFKSKKILTILNDLNITAVDIGARKGFTNDIIALAPYTNAIAFEPDKSECDRLNHRLKNQKNIPWKKITYLPHALGNKKQTTKLNLYKQRGCSSILEADQDLANNYNRSDYYIKEDTISLQTEQLDTILKYNKSINASFLKIDVQGYELEVFKGATNTLKNLMAIRIEVSFVPLYKKQPLFSDIDKFLTKNDFQFIDFIELHKWRKTSKNKLPYLSQKPYSYSKGEIIHGDALFFKDINSLKTIPKKDISKWLTLAMIAINYGYNDYAFTIFNNVSIQNYLKHKYDIQSITNELQMHSNESAKKFIRQQCTEIFSQIKIILKNLIKLFK